MPMAGMIQPQMGSMQPTMNGARQPQIGIQQQIPTGMQAQLQGNQIQAIQQQQQVQYVESVTPALNAPSHVEAHISDSGVNMLVEEVHRLRGEVEHIRSKSEEENIKLRSEVENARAMSAVESAKMQAMAEIERAKNEAKFAMQSGNISEAAATTVNNKAGAGDVLGDALMSAVAKMIVQGSINGTGNGATASVPQATQPIQNNASTNAQNNANAIPQCPPGGRMTTTTMVDMTRDSRQAQFSTDDSFM
ncbi:MAG: hypothetical protein K2I79_02005, partial [Clostridia bacterium]|nr:hypothetical protein [Clostridia bacterium]